MKYILRLVLLGLTSTARAQSPLPADCPPAGPPPASRSDIQVGIPLGSRPGFAMLGVPLKLDGGTCQAAQPSLPRDVLHGTPDPELLRGVGPRDVLHNSDPPTPESDTTVYIDVK